MIQYKHHIVLVTLISIAGCSSTSTKIPSWSQRGVEQSVHSSRRVSMARLAERHGQPETAKKLYETVLEEDPDHAVALHRLGVIAAHDQRFVEAVRFMQSALEQDADNPELLADLGYAYFLLDDLVRAEQTTLEVIRLDPRNKRSRNNLGQILAQQGRWEESLRQFQLGTDSAGAYANLAFMQSQLGELKLAEQNYHRAVDIDPANMAAAEGLVQLAGRLAVEETNTLAERTAYPERSAEEKTARPANVPDIVPVADPKIQRVEYQSDDIVEQQVVHANMKQDFSSAMRMNIVTTRPTEIPLAIPVSTIHVDILESVEILMSALAQSESDDRGADVSVVQLGYTTPSETPDELSLEGVAAIEVSGDNGSRESTPSTASAGFLRTIAAARTVTCREESGAVTLVGHSEDQQGTVKKDRMSEAQGIVVMSHAKQTRPVGVSHVDGESDGVSRIKQSRE